MPKFGTNWLAHDVAFSSFEWKAYYAGLDSNQKREFSNNFTYWLKGDEGLKPSDLATALEKIPQHLVHKSALFAVYQLYSACLQSKLDKMQNEAGRKLLEEKLSRPDTLRGLYGLVERKE